jgi:catechol 2,3-dioxygenase-like lactoylglutathione lyase family enzyme
VDRPVDLSSQFIRREGMAIELLHYRSPAVSGRPSTSRSQRGLTHLSFVVPSVDVAVAELERVGGTLLPSTRTTAPGVDLVFMADPDGTRIELMALGGTR